MSTNSINTRNQMQRFITAVLRAVVAGWSAAQLAYAWQFPLAVAREAQPREDEGEYVQQGHVVLQALIIPMCQYGKGLDALPTHHLAFSSSVSAKKMISWCCGKIRRKDRS